MLRQASAALVLSLLCVGLVSAQQQQQQPRQTEGQTPAIKLDGDWTVVYAEMDGKRVDDKSFHDVAIKNNVVTCRQDGKEKTFRLQFGPHNMIRCTEQSEGKTISAPTEVREQGAKMAAHTHHGVYVASEDYFCVAMDKGPDRRQLGSTALQDGVQIIPPPGQPQAVPQGHRAWTDQSPHGSHFVLILHRAGGNSTGRPTTK